MSFSMGEANTIGGFIGNQLRNIPKEGDSITEQDYRITVIEADECSVIKVRLERL